MYFIHLVKLPQRKKKVPATCQHWFNVRDPDEVSIAQNGRGNVGITYSCTVFILFLHFKLRYHSHTIGFTFFKVYNSVGFSMFTKLTI